MDYKIRDESSVTVLELTGELTFADNLKFRDIIGSLVKGPTRPVRLDMNKLKFIDSAGLGLLVLLKEEMATCGREASITGASGDVKRIMEVARFHEIVKIN